MDTEGFKVLTAHLVDMNRAIGWRMLSPNFHEDAAVASTHRTKSGNGGRTHLWKRAQRRQQILPHAPDSSVRLFRSFALAGKTLVREGSIYAGRDYAVAAETGIQHGEIAKAANKKRRAA